VSEQVINRSSDSSEVGYKFIWIRRQFCRIWLHSYHYFALLGKI